MDKRSHHRPNSNGKETWNEDTCNCSLTNNEKIARWTFSRLILCSCHTSRCKQSPYTTVFVEYQCFVPRSFQTEKKEKNCLPKCRFCYKYLKTNWWISKKTFDHIILAYTALASTFRYRHRKCNNFMESYNIRWVNNQTNHPGIIIKDHKNRMWFLVDLAVPANCNVAFKLS